METSFLSLTFFMVFVVVSEASTCGQGTYSIVEGTELKIAFPIQPRPSSLQNIELLKEEYPSQGKGERILKTPGNFTGTKTRGSDPFHDVTLHLYNNNIYLQITHIHVQHAGCYFLQMGNLFYQLQVNVIHKVEFVQRKRSHVEKLVGESINFTVSTDDIPTQGLTLVWVSHDRVKTEVYQFNRHRFKHGRVLNFMPNLTSIELRAPNKNKKSVTIGLHGLKESHSGLYKIFLKHGGELFEVNSGVDLCVTKEKYLDPQLELIEGGTTTSVGVADALKPATYLVTVLQLPQCIAKPDIKIDIRGKANITYEVDGVDHLLVTYDGAQEDECFNAVIHINYPGLYKDTKYYGTAWYKSACNSPTGTYSLRIMAAIYFMAYTFL